MNILQEFPLHSTAYWRGREVAILGYTEKRVKVRYTWRHTRYGRVEEVEETTYVEPRMLRHTPRRP